MSNPAVPELAQPPKAKRGSMALRMVVAAAAIIAVVWYLRSRHERTVSSGRPDGTASSDNGQVGRTGRRGGAPGAGGAPEGRVVTVEVATAERKDLPIWLEGLGTVAAVQQVTVRPQVDGRIEKVLFTEGQPVKRGEVLVQIDPRPFLVTLHQAQGALARDKAQLETQQANLKRYQGLKAQNLVAGQQVEEIAGQVGQFEGSVKIDQAQIESAQLQLDYAQVKSPLDGITGVRQVDAGNLIHASDPNGIVVITAIDPAAVFFTVPQDQLTAVAQALARGDVPVEVLSRDGTSKLATGKLFVLDNQVNQTTATLRLKALVPNPERLLWPNAFVKARMLIETRKDAIVIPTVAIQHGPQGTYVYAVGQDKTAQMKPVTIALTTGDLAVVGKGLDGGEQVIVEGQNQVRPGGRVEPVHPTGGPEGPAPGPGASERGRGKRGPSDDSRAQGGARRSAHPSPSSPEAAAPVGRPADTGRQAAPEAMRPVSGPSRPPGPATGPTASSQTPAAP
ncbi:MAG TPA: efflux RND transporter periplasmic adaptor subunit [Kofleriaceae bacterium]|jgi:multidrug efflux system membrane fusion protein|nr:efflux RND transporter periplasmic adaptor subunit [Kofleriaceae bacterium]